MIKNIATIITGTSVVVIVALCAMRLLTPPLKQPSSQPQIIAHSVEPYRCRTCNPYTDLCPEDENLNAATDDNMNNFALSIKRVFNDESILGIETKRLIFRQIRLDDADAIYEYARKPIVASRTTWAPHTSKFETIRLVENWVARYKKFYAVPWAVIEKSSGALIGTAGIPAVYPSEPRAYISYCISDTAWGQGYELEVIRALIEFATLQGKCIRVEMLVREDDQFSQKIAAQAGMSDEGIEYDYKRVGNEYITLRHYAILRKEIRDVLRRSVLAK